MSFFNGKTISVSGEHIDGLVAGELRTHETMELDNGDDGMSRFLVLQGRPIGESVAKYGPVVMNTQVEIMLTCPPPAVPT